MQGYNIKLGHKCITVCALANQPVIHHYKVLSIESIIK
jgi:hypothetical protein